MLLLNRNISIVYDANSIYNKGPLLHKYTLYSTYYLNYFLKMHVVLHYYRYSSCITYTIVLNPRVSYYVYRDSGTEWSLRR